MRIKTFNFKLNICTVYESDLNQIPYIKFKSMHRTLKYCKWKNSNRKDAYTYTMYTCNTGMIFCPNVNIFSYMLLYVHKSISILQPITCMLYIKENKCHQSKAVFLAPSLRAPPPFLAALFSSISFCLCCLFSSLSSFLLLASSILFEPVEVNLQH